MSALILAASLWVSVGLAQSAEPVPPPPPAGCDAAVGARDFGRMIAAGDAAYANMYEKGFREARLDAAQALPCLTEGLTPGQSAAFHRLEALAAFLDRDHAGAVASFKAVLAAAPGYTLPEAMAPMNHPMRTYFEIAANSPVPPGRPLNPPKAGWVHLDGALATEAPADRPFIYQRFGDGGRVIESMLVRPGITPPTLALASTPSRSSRKSGREINVGLASAAGVAALASGGFFLAAHNTEQAFWSQSTSQAELGALRTQTNTFGWLSAGFGAVALGTGTAALLVGTW